MFEGLYFEFPKLGFLLFFFLACEALCPLRQNRVYFPRIERFSETVSRFSRWTWLAKWSTVIFLIIALMSPVKEHRFEPIRDNGYDFLVVIDPYEVPPSVQQKIFRSLESFIARRDGDAFGIWIGGENPTLLPMTYEKDVLRSILMQLPVSSASSPISSPEFFERFFEASRSANKAVIWFSETGDSPAVKLAQTIPVFALDVLPAAGMQSMERSLTAIGERCRVIEMQDQNHYRERFYVYPLFAGLLTLLLYVYGRNRGGLK